MNLHRYPYVETSLANYFGVNVGHSEPEAIAMLGADIASSEDLRKGLQSELEAAFRDPSVQWAELLAQYEVCTGLSESEAADLVRTYLWRPAFERSGA